MPNHIEKQHQIALFKWASFNPILRDYLFAIPNGGRRDPREGASLRLQGVKAGIPDVCLAYPNKIAHGLYIELKRPLDKNKSNPVITCEQNKWLANLRTVGYEAVVCYGWEEAKKVIEDYLNNR